jgi:hypothetical protein
MDTIWYDAIDERTEQVPAILCDLYTPIILYTSTWISVGRILSLL